MLQSLFEPSRTLIHRSMRLIQISTRNTAQVSQRKLLAAQVQYEQAPKDVVLQATKQWVESIVLRYKLCPFAVTAHKKHKILYRVSKAKTSEALGREVRKHVRLMTKNDAKSESTKLLAVAGIERLYSFAEFNQFVNAMQELLKTMGSPIQLALFHPSFMYADTAADPDASTANYTSRSPYPLIHFIRAKQIDAARKKNGEAYLLGLSATNDRTLAAVGLPQLQRMHKELVPGAYLFEPKTMAKDRSAKTKFRANNKAKSKANDATEGNSGVKDMPDKKIK